jgi:hypothetical protein
MVVMRYLAVLALVFSGSYSYSEYTYGTTNNAADNRLNWVMKNVLPDASNLSVNGVFYQYTPVKVKEDAMKVHVQNENALGSGYIFRETDDWTNQVGGIPINKVVGVANIPEDAWGDGSIEVEGTGSVIDTSVIYSYQYDNTCANPIDDPTCPGYNDAIQSVLNSISEPVPYDTTNDVKLVLDEKVELEEEVDEEEQDEDRLEKALSAVDVGVLDANTIAQDNLLLSLTAGISVQSYYDKRIQGGVYEDTVDMSTVQMPDNKSGARVGLAQQIKHNEMVDMQYKLGE